MARSAEKIEALALRRKGESIKEIAKKLGVSSSTVSIWAREIVLTHSQQKLLYERQIAAGHRGRVLGAQINKERKLTRIRLAQEAAIVDIRRISKGSSVLYGIRFILGRRRENNTKFSGNKQFGSTCDTADGTMVYRMFRRRKI